MLDNLPTELILRTLRLASGGDPPPISLDPHREPALRTYSQVSQRLRACAQPLAWKTVDVRDYVSKEAVVEEAETTEMAKYARVLAVHDDAGTDHFVAVMKVLPNVVDVRLHHLKWMRHKEFFSSLSSTLLSLLLFSPLSSFLPTC
jgi:hypothetical protein